MDLGAAVVADEQPLEVVQPGEGALDDPADTAEAGAVVGLAPRNLGADAAPAQLAPVLVVVIGAIGEQPLGPLPRAATLARDRLDAVDQRQQLGDVVSVAARERDREQGAGGVAEQVVLGARSGTVDRRGPSQAPPWSARTWLPSITADDQSSLPAALRRRISSR